MAQKLPDWFKFPLTLLLVAVISAASLAALWTLTSKSREAIAREETEAAFKIVFPEADSFQPKKAEIDGNPFEYRLAMKGGEMVGYIAQGAASGYSSTLRVMVGVDKSYTIKGIKVLFQKETPGLGDKVNEILSKKTWGTIITGTSPDEKGLRPWFQIQFDGKKVPVKVQKDGGKIDAITGATISSRAVCNAVNEAVAKIKEAVGQ